MAFSAPAYSRNKVNEAGDILSRSPNLAEVPLEDLDREIERQIWAGDVLSNWRASHAYPINTFQATLRLRLKAIDRKAIVAQRLKRAVSILAKLRRFNEMRLARMQDIGGLRAVVGSVAKVRQLERVYRESKWQHQLANSKDYIHEPKTDGYRGVHLVFRYQNARAPQFNGLCVELQIRTKRQHEWATAVETMGTFLGQALKSGQGDAQWREFFALSSAALAHMERTPPVPAFETLTKEEVFAKVAADAARLRVVHLLQGFAVAAGEITRVKGPGSYHLIVLDSATRSVVISPFPVSKLAEAEAAYSEVEKQAKDGYQIDAVLVAAGPVEQLKLAYPNYFLDTQGFIRQVEQIVAAVGASK